MYCNSAQPNGQRQVKLHVLTYQMATGKKYKIRQSIHLSKKQQIWYQTPLKQTAETMKY